MGATKKVAAADNPSDFWEIVAQPSSEYDPHGFPVSHRLGEYRKFSVARRSSHVNDPRLGAFAAFARAGADQLALELGKPAKHSEHKPPVGRSRVRPCVAKRTKARAPLGDLRQRVEKVARRTRQPVKARHKERVDIPKGA
jgi:hypothetical protein